MKINSLILFILLTGENLLAGEPLYPKGFEPKQQTQSITFTENKGQVSDQYNKPRPDVLFTGRAGDKGFFLRNNGISYQFYRVDAWKKEDSVVSSHFGFEKEDTSKVPDQLSVYRVDVNWLNCNKNFSVRQDSSLRGCTHYYQEVCPNGVHDVKTYTGVYYNNIYNGIDLHYYVNDGELKYDYIIAPHVDPSQIRTEVKGAEKIILQNDGSVWIKTPFGVIVEGAPCALQNGNRINVKWKIENNVLCFDVQNYDPDLELIIDPPTRLWGTYYGGISGESWGYCATDPSGNVFLSGRTASSGLIATIGTHQSTIGGTIDAFLVKFDPNGSRLWATYYGGTDDEEGHECATDFQGNVFLTGHSRSTSPANVIASLGAHQTTLYGVQDAFLVKFNPSGQRLWGTYYGGNVGDYGYSLCTDLAGNVFLGGETTSYTGTLIASPNGHQPTYGGNQITSFLAKFNSSGVRQWGSYYGGLVGARTTGCSTDGSGNVFLSGTSLSTASIATIGSHQPALGAQMNAFLAKFNAAGVRQWATYYGGTVITHGEHCAADMAGNVYLCGQADSGAAVATPGCQQTIYGGGPCDLFVVKFDASGTRLWGTYYGGDEREIAHGCVTDSAGNLLVAGETRTGWPIPASSTAIATPGAHQPLHGGGVRDAFLIKFSAGGTRLWGTFYGGISHDFAYSCAAAPFQKVFLSGVAGSFGGTTIATPGSHQPVSNSNDLMLVKFDDNCPIAQTPTVSTNYSVFCFGGTTTITALSNGNIYWYPSGISSVAIATGSVFVPNITTPGSYTFYAESYSCEPSASRTAITITVYPSPTITVSNGSICLGQTFTINPAGANSYTISGGNFVLSPTVNTNYSVTGTSSAGCISNTIVASVTVNPLPNITAVSNPSSICSGESAVLTASGANNYTWIPSGNTNTILVTPNTTTTYSVIGIDNKGCSNTASISILAKPNPTVSVNNATICSGTQAILNANVNPNTGIVYNWLPGGENSSSITVNPNATSVYSLSVNLDGCLSMTTSTVTIVTAISPNVAFSYNGPYCTNQNPVSPSLTLAFANGGQFFSTPEGLNLNPNTGEINPTTSEPGIYQITYTLAASGCSTSASGTANIQITVPAQLNLAPQVGLLTGESYTLNVSGASSYSWSPPEFLSCTDCQNPIASPPYSMTYCVSSPNEVCVAKTCISIDVETGCQGRELSLPNAFSPNGDGNNDEYCLLGWNECIAEFKIIIYNRWGEKVFESEKTEFCWDGSYKGKTQETEVFVYMLKAKLKDGTQISKNGNITLLR